MRSPPLSRLRWLTDVVHVAQTVTRVAYQLDPKLIHSRHPAPSSSTAALPSNVEHTKDALNFFPTSILRNRTFMRNLLSVTVRMQRSNRFEKVGAMARFCIACGAAIGEGVAFCGQCGSVSGGAPGFATKPQQLRRGFPGWVLITAGVAAAASIVMLVWLMQPTELGQEQARELITLNMSEAVSVPLDIEQEVFPVNISVDPQTGAFADFHQSQINEARSRLEQIKQAGYITFEEEVTTGYLFRSRLSNVVFHIKPTAKLEPFIAEKSPNGRTLQVKIGQIIPDMIVSITPTGDDLRLVRYTRKVELNVLAKLLQTSEVPANPGDAEASFARVDGEWVPRE